MTTYFLTAFITMLLTSFYFDEKLNRNNDFWRKKEREKEAEWNRKELEWNRKETEWDSKIRGKEWELRREKQKWNTKEADWNTKEADWNSKNRDKEWELRREQQKWNRKELEWNKKENILSKFLSIPISEIIELVEINEDIYGIYSKRVLNKVENIRRHKEKVLQDLREKPILSRVAHKIEGDKNARQIHFLEREKERCLDVADKNGFVIPEWAGQKVKCNVLRVIDGDTFLVSVNGVEYRIRTAGYDTPEVCKPFAGYGHFGIEASYSAQKIVENSTEFEIELDSEQLKNKWVTDRYGRLVAHLYADGVLFGKTLIEGGFAEYVDVFFLDNDVRNLYQYLEKQAKLSKVGMWEKITEYESQKKKNRVSKKYEDMVENYRDYKGSMISLQDLIGTMVRKTKRSTIFHKTGCHHLSRSYALLDVELTDDDMATMRPCKSCHGDDLISEIIKD